MTIEVTTKKLFQVWNKLAVRLNRIQKLPTVTVVWYQSWAPWEYDHDALGEPIMPSSILWVEGNPEKPKPQYQPGQQCAQETDNCS